MFEYAEDVPFVMHWVANHITPGVTALLRGGPLGKMFATLKYQKFEKDFLLRVK